MNIKEDYPEVEETDMIEGLDYTFVVQFGAGSEWTCTLCKFRNSGKHLKCRECRKQRTNYGFTKKIEEEYQKAAEQ